MGGKLLYFALLTLFFINLLFTAVVADGSYGLVAWYAFMFILLFVAAAVFFIGFFTRKSWTTLAGFCFFILAIINSIVFWALSKNMAGALFLVINAAGLEIMLLRTRWFRRITTSPPFFSKEKAIEKELPGIEEPGLIIEEDIEEESPVKYIANAATMTFHVPECRYAKQISAANKVFFDSRKEAVQSKYKPCRCTEE